MNVVALETSGRPSSVAVSCGGEILEEVLQEERAHASDLLPALERLMEKAGLAPADIESVFVGIGPGSYTGLRVGLATALGLARGSAAPIYAVPSGETRVYAECEPGTTGALLLDARQGELYFAHYERTPDDVRVLVAPKVTTPSELGALLPEAAVVLGDEAVAENEAVTGLDARTRENVRVPRQDGGFPRAAALLELGLARVASGTLEPTPYPEPLYLRPFAAKPRKRP